MEPVTTVRLWGRLVASGVALAASMAVGVGVPVAAARFDDPARYVWLLVVPVLVAFGVYGLIAEPYAVILSDGGVGLRWLNRSRQIPRQELAGVVVPKRTFLLGEGLTLVLTTGERVELPNTEDRLWSALVRRFPELAADKSDARYLGM